MCYQEKPRVSSWHIAMTLDLLTWLVRPSPTCSYELDTLLLPAFLLKASVTFLLHLYHSVTGMCS